MAPHLPPPPGEPDPGAREIMAAITAYRESTRDPLNIIRGLRHVYAHAENGWDASLVKARETCTYAAMAEAAGTQWSTLQNRIKSYRRRQAEESP